MKKTPTILIILGLIVFCGIVVFFRVFSVEELPASFVGAFLGAIITGVVTMILLKAQSQAEEIREKNAKVFEQKSAIFQDYIKKVWKTWEDHKVSAEEFQELTSDYYSKLMIYLHDNSITEISDCLSKISECIDKADENHNMLRENVIKIINILSDEINLGGHIDIEKVKEIDSKVFPLLFKKTLISELKSKMMNDTSLFLEPQLVKAYSRNNEWLQFIFKEYPDCKVSIGPFDAVGELKMGLDINRKLHQFDKYRNQVKKYSHWIISNGKKEYHFKLNEKLPNDEDANEIEAAYNLGKINNFGFNDITSLKQFEGCYQKLSALLAQRAAYYLNSETINDEYSMAEFPERIMKLQDKG